MAKIAIVGVSGFSGMELSRLVASRGELELVAAFADSWRGLRLGARVELPEPAASLVVRPLAELDLHGADADVVCLATPAEASAELAPKLVARGQRVLDLSGAFRLRDLATFRAYYGFEHPSPGLVGEACFGIPQLPLTAGDGPSVREARIVANPGCYATAATLPLAALLARDADDGRGPLVEAAPLFVDGKSGVTGAGRKVAEKYLFTEVAENVSPYRVANHQHTPEIEQALARVAGEPVSVTFAAHLLPVKRGLVTTTYGRMRAGVTSADVERRVASYYAKCSSPLGEIVRAVGPDEATIASVANTVRATIAARGDDARGTFVAIGAIDNLLKGAASQALENLLAMIG
jgi:N-acetyl-gamma-glutamyl-phosphate reductase